MIGRGTGFVARTNKVKEKPLEWDYNYDKNKKFHTLEDALCRHIIGSFIRKKLIVFQ